MSQNTVILKNYSDVFEEITAGGTIYPGQLLLQTGVDTVIAHNDDAPTAACLPMFAVEDALQGKGIDDAYVTGDPVKCWIPGRGDQVYAVLENGANVAAGAFLESNGAGFLQAFSSGNGAIAIALEALDLSGSSRGDTELNDQLAPFEYARRIKVRVI